MNSQLLLTNVRKLTITVIVGVLSTFVAAKFHYEMEAGAIESLNDAFTRVPTRKTTSRPVRQVCIKHTYT